MAQVNVLPLNLGQSGDIKGVESNSSGSAEQGDGRFSQVMEQHSNASQGGKAATASGKSRAEQHSSTVKSSSDRVQAHKASEQSAAQAAERAEDRAQQENVAASYDKPQNQSDKADAEVRYDGQDDSDSTAQQSAPEPTQQQLSPSQQLLLLMQQAERTLQDKGADTESLPDESDEQVVSDTDVTTLFVEQQVKVNSAQASESLQNSNAAQAAMITTDDEVDSTGDVVSDNAQPTKIAVDAGKMGKQAQHGVQEELAQDALTDKSASAELATEDSEQQVADTALPASDTLKTPRASGASKESDVLPVQTSTTYQNGALKPGVNNDAATLPPEPVVKPVKNDEHILPVAPDNSVLTAEDGELRAGDGGNTKLQPAEQQILTTNADKAAAEVKNAIDARQQQQNDQQTVAAQSELSQKNTEAASQAGRTAEVSSHAAQVSEGTKDNADKLNAAQQMQNSEQASQQALKAEMSGEQQHDEQHQPQQNASQQDEHQLIFGTGVADTGVVTESAHGNQHSAAGRIEQLVQNNVQLQKQVMQAGNDSISLQHKDFAAAMKDKVMVMIQQNIQRADIRLDPPELGQMHVRVHMQNEQMMVNFVVQNQQAKEALEQNMPKLKDMLAQSGVNVGDANVEQQQQQASSKQQSGGFGQSAPLLFADESLESAEVFSASLVKGSTTGVDYYA